MRVMKNSISNARIKKKKNKTIEIKQNNVWHNILEVKTKQLA